MSMPFWTAKEEGAGLFQCHPSVGQHSSRMGPDLDRSQTNPWPPTRTEPLPRPQAQPHEAFHMQSFVSPLKAAVCFIPHLQCHGAGTTRVLFCGVQSALQKPQCAWEGTLTYPSSGGGHRRPWQGQEACMQS